VAKRKEFAPAIEQAINAAAERHGLNPVALKAFARIESGGNPTVQTGSYKGLFQLSNGEFRRYGGKGDIFDPVENTNAAAAKLAAESARLERSLGRTPTAGDVYLVHQQGEGGAMEHRRNPERAAWESMYATAEGQKKGEAWAKKAIWGNIPNSDKQRFGSVDNVTSRDFMQLWNDKVAKFGGAKSITELAMKGGGAATQATQLAQAPPLPEQKPPQQMAAVSPEGLQPGQSAAPGMADGDNPQQAIAQAAPDMVGPLGPVGTPGSATQPNAVAEAQPILPTPSETPNASPTLAGGGILSGTLASVFGISPGGGGGILGMGKGGGGGVKTAGVSVPDMGNTYASFSQMESSMGPSSDDVLAANIPPPPPRTPEGLPVGNFSEMAKRRRRSQVG
jgi:hypothetical protein